MLRDIVRKMASTLRIFSLEHLVHCDIKPENILIKCDLEKV